MQKYVTWLMLICMALLVQGQESSAMAQSSAFQLTSKSFNADGTFKMEQVANGFGCTGGNVSPDFSWTGAPEGTKSFGLSIYDMDAPTGSGFWHWAIFNIPASTTSLPAGAGDPAKKLAPSGSVQGHNDAGISGYFGPCPPQGDRPHRYQVTLFALKTDKIPLDESAAGALIGFYLNGDMLAKTTIAALYSQPSAFQLTSKSVNSDSTFKMEQVANGFGCTGGNVSPDFSWAGVPDGTKSLALTMYDMDAPTGSGFWHWMVFNMPPVTTSLPAGAGDPAKKLAPSGSVQSRNDAGISGYFGPCPPQGDKPHHYLVTLFALKTDKISLDESAAGALTGFYLNANAISTTTLILTYAR